MQQATFKETKSCEGHFLVVLITLASEPILVCSLINLRGGFKELENYVNTHKKLALQFFVRNNVQLTKSFPESLVATERQKYRMTSTGECLVQQQSLYTSGCPVQVINDS